MASQWLATFLALGFALATALFLFFAAAVAGPRRRGHTEPLTGPAEIRRPSAAPVGFFAAALVTLLLCAQTVILFPWAASFRDSVTRFSLSALFPIGLVFLLAFPLFIWMLREGILGSGVRGPMEKEGDRS